MESDTRDLSKMFRVAEVQEHGLDDYVEMKYFRLKHRHVKDIQ